VGRYNDRVNMRIDSETDEILDKVQKGFGLSNRSETIRLIIHLWYKSLNTDAVDEEELGRILGKKLVEHGTVSQGGTSSR